MPKLRKEANLFFEKNKEHIDTETIKQLSSNVKKIFSIDGIPLTDSEKNQIKYIILTATKQDVLDEKSTVIFEELKTITAQIKGIQKQGILLIGEKIFEARNLINQNTTLNTTFSDWISVAFKTKSSAYNALAYYEFYKNLPTNESRLVFQSIPYKAAYVLSSRRVCIEDKCKALANLKGLSNVEAISFIDRVFPKKNRKSSSFLNDQHLVDVILNKMSYLASLLSTFSTFDDSQRKELNKIVRLLSSII